MLGHDLRDLLNLTPPNRGRVRDRIRLFLDRSTKPVSVLSKMRKGSRPELGVGDERGAPEARFSPLQSEEGFATLTQLERKDGVKKFQSSPKRGRVRDTKRRTASSNWPLCFSPLQIEEGSRTTTSPSGESSRTSCFSPLQIEEGSRTQAK